MSSDIPPVPSAPKLPTAKDDAKALDRRQRRRKLVMLLALAALIAAVIVYGTCGNGFGLGKGTGEGDGSGSAQAAVDAGPRRCKLVVSVDGITLDGAKTTRDEAVKTCKGGGAEVIVTGDAREGDWKQLEAALAAAKIEVFVRK
jgi:hypothetical protein